MFLCLKKQTIYNFLFSLAVIVLLSSVVTPKQLNYVPVVATPLGGKTILIDPGHGTPDGGAVGMNGSIEKDINLAISKKIGNYLIQSGAKVIYTRMDDYSVSYKPGLSIRDTKNNDMSKRRDIRDNSDADIFISVHTNKYSDSKYYGAQVFYDDKNNGSNELANYIQSQIKAFADETNTRNAKDAKGSIFIIRDSKMPSVLIECGFLSNYDEELRLMDETYQSELSYAIYSGILKYLTNT